MSSSSSSSSGLSLGTILFIVFLILKLTGHITWSWWWVTCPLWITVGVALLLIGGGLCIAGLCLAIALIWDKRSSR